MELNSFTNRSFLETLQLLPHEVFNYTKIDAHEADLLTEKAVFLTFDLKRVRHERWIPFSQLRKDNNNIVWLSKWMIKNLKLNEEKKYPPQETSGEIICD